MKTSTVSFAQLRRLLLSLHFTEARKEKGWRFEHPESDAIFLFRPYKNNEKISMADLMGTRMQLDWRGLLSAEAFDSSLTKTPA
jgi:hypothetical protein